MKKSILVVAVFVFCMLSASKFVSASWYHEEVTKSGSANVESYSIVSNNTGIYFSATSDSGTVNTEVIFRKYADSSFTVIIASQLSVSEGTTQSMFLNHNEGNFYRLRLRGWGQGTGYIEVYSH